MSLRAAESEKAVTLTRNNTIRKTDTRRDVVDTYSHIRGMEVPLPFFALCTSHITAQWLHAQAKTWRNSEQM